MDYFQIICDQIIYDQSYVDFFQIICDQIIYDQSYMISYTLKLVQGASALSSIPSLEVVRLESNRSTKIDHLHYLAVNCEKFELGSRVQFYASR